MVLINKYLLIISYSITPHVDVSETLSMHTDPPDRKQPAIFPECVYEVYFLINIMQSQLINVFITSFYLNAAQRNAFDAEYIQHQLSSLP